jgi:hypothetical protein
MGFKSKTEDWNAENKVKNRIHIKKSLLKSIILSKL